MPALAATIASELLLHLSLLSLLVFFFLRRSIFLSPGELRNRHMACDLLLTSFFLPLCLQVSSHGLPSPQTSSLTLSEEVRVGRSTREDEWR